MADSASPNSSARAPYHPLVPVPADAPDAVFKHPKRGDAIRVFTYRDASGALLGYTCLFGGDGRRAFLPLTYCWDVENKRGAWRWQAMPKLRPLYGLPGLAVETEAPVLLVSNELAAEYARELYPDDLAVSWPGGLWKAAEVDWSSLRGRDVALWVDHPARRYAPPAGGRFGPLMPREEQPGWRAARALAGVLKAHGVRLWTLVAPHEDEELSDGWNLADAAEQGWDKDTARTWFMSHLLAPDFSRPVEQKEQADPGAIDGLLERFTLIYPTETAWDETCEKIVKVSAMRMHFGRGLVDLWLAHPQRRAVLEENVVFDPSGQADPEKTVNLFRGLPGKPSSEGSCQRLLELLQYLCGEADQDIAPLTEWVLKWAAYPLQRPGAKMRTAVVMYGAEGAGKNLFWGAVADIYGPYATFITQFQLQSQFNDWASRKMFVIANEVVTQAERKHLVGYLKNLVTEERIPIETKNMPVRIEDNRMQLVFFSNELHPLRISPGDRRYQVIRTPAGLEPEFYEKVAAEIAAAGVARLHEYLLHEVDIGDFNEHTKPILTEAKEALVEIGLSSTQMFWRELHDGALTLPYGPCQSTDLYRAYQYRCPKMGEKVPAKINVFSQEFMSMNGVRRQVKRVPLGTTRDGEVREIQRTLFIMGQPKAGMSEEEWIRRSVEEFRDQLRSLLDGEREW